MEPTPSSFKYLRILVFSMGIILMGGAIFLCVVVYHQVYKNPNKSINSVASYEDFQPIITDTCNPNQITLPSQGTIESVAVYPPTMLFSVLDNKERSLIILDYCTNKVLSNIVIHQPN